MGRLDGKVALVTGGARGMGASHVRRLTAEGAQVVFGDVLETEGAALAAEVGARFVTMDVTDPDDWTRAVEAAVEAFGSLNVLVNNAGIIRHRSIKEMPLEDFRRVLDVNLVGTWLGVKSVIEPMRAAGGGSIINVSSVEGFIGGRGLSAYSASKFGVRGVTKAAARELGGYGIRVNSIHPGAIISAMTMDPELVDGSETDVDAFFRSMPLSRMGKPREVSGLIVFLASDDSSYCTGTELLVDGGILTGAGY